MRATLVVSVMLMAGLCSMVVAGSLEPTGPPTAGSGMYTLQNLYDYLTSGTALTVQSSFQEPTSEPGSTMKTTKEIGDAIAGKFSQCNVTADNVESGKTFFCTVSGSWGVQTGTLSALPRPTATPTITPTITPTMAGGAWVLVPGNPTYHPTDFYVMKYEAKQGSGSGDAQQANSIAAGYPWLNIPQYIPSGISAVKACTNIGDGYHLCTAKEAQTINRNIEAQASNWRDGTKISSDCMYGGHMANNPASALAASTDDNPYSGMTAKGTDAFNCPFISSATGKEQRRTFTLSNGTVIWDWSGNVWEWISGDGTDGQIDSTGGVTTWSTASGVEWSTISNERSVLGPSDSSWTASQGMGRYYGGASTNAFYRGGAWSHGASAGCFGLRLDVAPSVTSTDIGFRCCR